MFGQDGPYSPRPGLDRVGIGYGGLLHLTGYPDRPPVRVGVTISDYLTGVFAAQAAVARAVRARRARRQRRGDRRRALRRGAAHPRVDARRLRPARHRAQPRGQPARQLRAARQLPDRATASTCASSPAPTRTSPGCARRWTAPTCSTTRASRKLADRAAHGDEINGIVAEWTATLDATRDRGALRRARRAGRDRVHRGRHLRRPAHGRPRRPRDRRRSRHRADAPAGAVPAASSARPPVAPTGAPRLGAHTDEVLGVARALRRRARRPRAPEGVV